MKKFLERLQIVVKENVIEVALSLMFFILGCYLFDKTNEALVNVLFFFPTVFILSYTLNCITDGTKWRFAYYLSLLLPFVAYTLDKDKAIASAFIALLLYFTYDWQTNNDSFVRKVVMVVKAAILSGIFSLIINVLNLIIFFSIEYIFDIWTADENRVVAYFLSLTAFLLIPCFFLGFYKDKKEDYNLDKLLNILFNYILTPALFIYTAILYLYIIKISISGVLPKGNLAYIVSIFVTALYIIKGCQVFLIKRLYDWFFNLSSFIVLPPLAIFWIGALYRINEYGFTVDRVYLVVIGVILTVVALMFIIKATSHYVYLSLFTIITLASVTYIPYFTAKEIAQRSQESRGNISQYEDTNTPKDYIYIQLSSPINISGYNKMQIVNDFKTDDEDSTSLYASTNKDTLYLYDNSGKLLFKEEQTKLLHNQMIKNGMSLQDSITKQDYTKLLTVQLDSAILVLDRINAFKEQREGSSYGVNDIWAAFYITK